MQRLFIARNPVREHHVLIGCLARVRFAARNGPERFDTFIEWARIADEAGLDLIGAGDFPLLWADPYVTLTMASLNTRRARIGPTISNPVTRHPSVAAAAIASVQQVSGGRAFFGLASGDSAGGRGGGVRPGG